MIAFFSVTSMVGLTRLVRPARLGQLPRRLNLRFKALFFFRRYSFWRVKRVLKALWLPLRGDYSQQIWTQSFFARQCKTINFWIGSHLSFELETNPILWGRGYCNYHMHARWLWATPHFLWSLTDPFIQHSQVILVISFGILQFLRTSISIAVIYNGARLVLRLWKSHP